MKPITAVVPHVDTHLFDVVSRLAEADLVAEVILLAPSPPELKPPKCTFLPSYPLTSALTLTRIISAVKTGYFLLVTRQGEIISLDLASMVEAAAANRAGLFYCDFLVEEKSGASRRPLNDYQPGSVRDDFDFGPLMLFSAKSCREALDRHGPLRETEYAGLYDLRLRVSLDHPIVHLAEPLYRVGAEEKSASGEGHFAYVDPRNRSAQREMEAVFTDHLKRIGAYLPPRTLEARDTDPGYPVEASVIIPVLNRRETIGAAIQSALTQETDFPFNILVIDNHSTDGTGDVVGRLARSNANLIHLIPKRRDLGIGGCWNEAIRSPHCGRYAVQLDSDDLYRTKATLRKIVHKCREENYALVVGSYTIVDEKMREIPPGLIDHREWTDDNGHNNALRINGLGAPRAFHTGTIRKIGFLNVSYGEDYAATLAIARKHPVGRIYESIYLCRRWPGNTDAGSLLGGENRHDAFKDSLRTAEILARQRLLRKESEPDGEDPGGKKPNPAFAPERTDESLLINHLYSSFSGEGSLPDMSATLLENQENTWEELKEGYRWLEKTMVRDLPGRGFAVRILHNEGRIKSTAALRGNPEEPCFLCLKALPPAQKGILFRGEYLILCNPYPVFPSHFTVSHLNHLPQTLEDRFENFLDLACRFGPGFLALYNGARCGASAPDHHHFHVLPAGELPLEKEGREEERQIPIQAEKGAAIFRLTNLGREVLLITGDDLFAITGVFHRLMRVIRKLLALNEEPLINALGSYHEGTWRVFLALRGRHRPADFFLPEEERLMVSPGAIDIGGVIITPVKKDFLRLDGSYVERIYREVSLDRELVSLILTRLTS